ncbi:MAG: ABC transporter transmembrane domain-containing protein, partial [Bdellovibrionia bacterium]
MIRAKPFPFSIPAGLVWPALKQKATLLAAAGLALAGFGAGLLVPFLSQRLLDGMLAGLSAAELARSALAVTAAAGAGIAAFLARQKLLAEFSYRYDLEVSTYYYGHALSLPARFFARDAIGTIYTGLSELMNLRRFLSASSLRALIDLISVGVYTIALYFYSPLIALLVVPLFLAGALIQISFRAKLRRRYDELLTKETRVNSILAEMVAAIGALKAAGATEQAHRKWESELAGNLELRRKIQMTATSMQGLTGITAVVARAAALGFGTLLVFRGELTAGQILAVTMYLDRLLAPVAGLALIFTELEKVKTAVKRIAGVLDAESEETAQHTENSPVLELRGNIRLENVGFRYDPEAPWVLRNLTLEIKAGETIAVAGASGSG